MSEPVEQRDPEVFTLDHLFEGVPDLLAPPPVEGAGAVDDPPEDAAPALPGSR